MIEARVASREEVFISHNELIQCTFEQWNALRNVMKFEPGVSVYEEFEPQGHTIVRHFPVPSITTLPEEPHG